MSTCPDADLYSAYVDGEVPSPWKEKLENHIASCPKCKKQADRYRNLHAFMAAGLSSDPKPDLEASWVRLCARRDAILPSGRNAVSVKIPEWIHLSVRLPITALAAMLIAAVFIPALIIMKTTGNIHSQEDSFALVEQKARNLETLVSNQIYSPDLPAKTFPVQSVVYMDSNVFKMVNYARQFAEDPDLFSDTDIVIIKLPKLTRLSETEDIFNPDDENLLQAVGYYK